MIKHQWDKQKMFVPLMFIGFNGAVCLSILQFFCLKIEFVCLKYTIFVHPQELERSNKAIEKLFTPLNHYIYGTRVVISMDCPGY